MKKTMITLLLGLTLTVSAQQVEYEREDSVRVMELLNGASCLDTVGENRMGEWMVHFGRAIMDMGIPYVGHTLEPFDKERLIINLRQMDCTTFTENVVALSLCMKNGLTSFEAFCHILQKIRYEKGDVPTYSRRLHYFTTWILDNTDMGFCHEIQSPNPPFTEVQTVRVDYMSKNPSKYRMLTVNPGDIPAIRRMESDISGKTFRYIPKQEVKNTALLRNTVHNGDILAIITNIKGLDTQHIGIAVWHDDGLHLLNASSIHKKVVEEPMTLRQYLYKHPTMPGIRVVRIND
ncbi:MAG: DUF1460 domain-containing protein [Prevotella sp.]|nr:DUF1460 domain-containing protein [Prevotella sp.]MBR1462745.1 DUF1460 domain-containing protein [Prevotella sp.]